MSAMSERAALIDQLITDLPAEDLKALAERLASQVGYALVAEPKHPDGTLARHPAMRSAKEAVQRLANDPDAPPYVHEAAILIRAEISRTQQETERLEALFISEAGRLGEIVRLRKELATGTQRRLAFYDAIRQALDCGSGPMIDELPQEVAQVVRQRNEVLAWLQDANTVHLNMLRGGIAKLTPAQIGHLYCGEEAAAVIREVTRQNPVARELAP